MWPISAMKSNISDRIELQYLCELSVPLRQIILAPTLYRQANAAKLEACSVASFATTFNFSRKGRWLPNRNVMTKTKVKAIFGIICLTRDEVRKLQLLTTDTISNRELTKRMWDTNFQSVKPASDQPRENGGDLSP